MPHVFRTEPLREQSFSSAESSPEAEPDEQTFIAENVQVQKRKDGRKAACLTFNVQRSTGQA